MVGRGSDKSRRVGIRLPCLDVIVGDMLEESAVDKNICIYIGKAQKHIQIIIISNEKYTNEYEEREKKNHHDRPILTGQKYY